MQGEVSPLLETDTSTRGQVIQSQQIEELPLNKRDYTQLVLLVPGTTLIPTSGLAEPSASTATAVCKRLSSRWRRQINSTRHQL